MRHDLDEAGPITWPVFENPTCDGTASMVGVLLHQALQQNLVGHAEVTDIHLAVAFQLVAGFAALAGGKLFRNGLECDLCHVAAGLEGAILIEYVGNATGHPGCEVTPRHPENDNCTAGHVLATVVANSLDHDGGT